MSRGLLATIVLTLAATLQAVEPEYSIFDTHGVVSATNVRSFIVWSEPWIRQYPPRFRNTTHREEVIRVTKKMVDEIDHVELATLTDSGLVVDMAYILAMAHNLDLGTAPRAKVVFEHALSLDPNDRRANYLFGMFLISTRKYHFDSERYLQNAYDLGEKEAQYPLALLQVEKGNETEGLRMLEEYAAENPDNKHVRQVIDAIKSGSIQFKSSSGG